jgi:hypothetical protein
VRAVLLAAALAAGCYFSDARVDFDYGACADTAAPLADCEPYYAWHPGWWTIGGIWVSGYYVLRPEYRLELRSHRVHVRRR